MNNFTKSSGNAYWHAITNLTCCNIDLKKMQLFKTFLVLMLFAFSSTSMFAQQRSEFYEVCVEDRPEGLTEEQALALFPNMECEGTLSVVITEDLQGGDCGWVSKYSYHLLCDSEEISVVKVIYEGGDLEAPKLEVPADITVECDAIPDPGTPTATDNCDEDVEIKYDGEIRIGDDDCNYTLERTWTAIDDCGLTHTLTQIITVLDTKGPQLNKGAKIPTGEDNMNVCYSDLPEGPSEEYIKGLFSDNCGNVIVIKEPVFKGSDCMWKGYINYYITDDCGNPADTITLNYNGGDTESPVFVDAPGDIEVNCIDLIPANYVLQWTDNCSVSDPKSKGVAVEDRTNLGEDCEGGSMTRTWTAQDDCGNEVTHTQTITVAPAPPVAFDEADEVIDIKCEELEAFVAGTLGYSNGGEGACDINGTVQGVAEDFDENCGSFTVTYTYEDTCNSIQFVQTINVIDDVKPELIIPVDVTVECDEVPGVGEASATDNCDTDVDVKYDGEERTDGDCADSYTLTRTWTATDNCGNSTTLSQTITVQDTTKPVLTIPADDTVECDAVPAIGEASATDNCDADVQVDFIEEKFEYGDDECADTYIIFRIWKATDNCGNTDIKTQKITVVDTTDPELTIPADDTVECDAVPAPGTATAVDNCDENVNVVYDGEERTDGSCEDNYTLTRTWTATDCAGNSTTLSQVITVQDTTNPEIVVPVDITVECDEVPQIGEASGTDNCDKDVTIEFVDEKRTDGDCADNYTLSRTWRATDNCGNSVTGTQTITVQDTTDPVLSVPANVTVECDAVPAVGEASATDNCDADVLVEFVNEDRVDGDCPNNYTLYRIWIATDNCGNTDTKTQIIEVEDTTAPTFTAPEDITIYTDEDCKYVATTDVTGNASNEADNCSEGLKATFSDEIKDGNCEGEKIITRTWSLMDECGNEAADQVQTITVKDNIAPTFTAPADMDLDCSDDTSVANTGDVTDEADNCSTGLNASYNDVIIPSDCATNYVIKRTWSLEDNCGNKAEDQVQTITVTDTTAPTIEGTGGDMTIECPVLPEFSQPTVSDDCDSAPSLTFEDKDDRDDCGLGTITRTWTATDCAGNTSSTSQSITVEDNVAPVIDGVGDDFTVECPEDYKFSEPTASDACSDTGFNVEDWTAYPGYDGAINITSSMITIVGGDDGSGFYDDSVVVSTCPINGTYSFDWSYSTEDDPYWDFAYSINGTIFLLSDQFGDDVQSGTLTLNCAAGDIIGWGVYSLDSIGGPATLEVTNYNAPGTGVDLTFEDTDTLDDCGLGTITRTWTAIDCAGNVSTDAQTITIEDNTAPVITEVGGPETIDCPDQPVFSEPKVSDTCDANPKLEFVDDDKRDECGLGDVIRTWTATDCAGNTSTASQTITVRDITDPTWDQQDLPQEVTEECDAVTPAATLTASDTCDTDIDVVFTEVKTEGNCPGYYTLDRTWTATDCAGNFIEHKQKVNVIDTTAPVEGEGFELPISENEINGCADDYMEAPLTKAEFAAMFTDNCSNVVVDLFSSPVGNDCGWSIIHIYTVSDDCGNLLGDYKVYYSGEDLTDPELDGVPADVTISCTDVVPDPANVIASDNCDKNVKLDYDQIIVQDNDEDCNNYDIIRTWTATDACGNSVSESQTIQVRDMEAPKLVKPLPEGSNENDLCAPDTDDELAALGVLTEAQFADLYTDDCNEVVVNRVINLDGDDCKWIMWVRYDITDTCGNEAQSVKIWYHGADMTAPVSTGLCENETIEILTSEYGVCPADANISLEVGDEITTDSGVWSIAGRDFIHANLMPCFKDNCTAQEDLIFRVAAIDEGDDKACPRTMTITFDVVDTCGNEYKGFVCTFVIIDDVDPVIEDCPTNIVVQPDFVAPTDIDGFTTLGLSNGKYYYLSNADMTGAAAHADALSNGGFAVTINDASEEAFVKAAVASVIGDLPYWIGLTDVDTEGTFVWQDGDPSAYRNWDGGEPNSAGDEDYVEGNSPYSASSYWNDEKATSLRPYVLELDAIQGNDAVVTFDAPTASDNCDLVSFEQTAGLPSGSEFPIGTTTVTYTATDACGNTAECSFDVTVEGPVVDACDTITFVSDCWNIAYYLTGTDDQGYPLYDYGQWQNAEYPELDYSLFYNHDLGQWEGHEYYDIGYGVTDYLLFTSVTDSSTPPSELGQWISNTNCDPMVDVICGDIQIITSPSYSTEYSFGHKVDNQLQANDASQDFGVELDFAAYPVPFDRDVNVKFNFEFDTDVTIDVHDTKGLLVKSLSLTNVRAGSDVKKSFDLSRAGDQLFYITVTTNQGSVTKKVVSSNMKRR